MTNDGIASRLDKVIAILQLAHRDAIERARIAIRFSATAYKSTGLI